MSKHLREFLSYVAEKERRGQVSGFSSVELKALELYDHWLMTRRIQAIKEDYDDGVEMESLQK